MNKYMIRVLPNRQFELLINASEKASDEPNWVPASKDPFPDLSSAEEGMRIILRRQAWLYDESGKPISG